MPLSFLRPLATNLLILFSLLSVSHALAESPRPATPTGLSLTPGNQSITVHWQPVPQAQGYLLYYGTQPQINTIVFDSYTQRIALSAEQTDYTIHALADDTDYYFIITSLHEGRPSAPSERISGRVDPSCSLLNQGQAMHAAGESAQALAHYQHIRSLDPDGQQPCTPHIYGAIAALYQDAAAQATTPEHAATHYQTAARYYQAFAYGLLCQQGDCAPAHTLWCELDDQPPQ